MNLPSKLQSLTPPNTLQSSSSATPSPPASPPPSPTLHPYAPSARQYLLSSNSTGASSVANVEDVAFEHKGWSGWTTERLIEGARGAGGIVDLLRRAELRHKSRQNAEEVDVNRPHCPLVVLLTGTNDLAHSTSSSSITTSLSTLHNLVYSTSPSSSTVALTIPPSKYTSLTPSANLIRTEVNAWINHFCETESRCVAVVPLAETLEMMAPDGLHFSVEGYREMGVRVGRVIEGGL